VNPQSPTGWNRRWWKVVADLREAGADSDIDLLVVLSGPLKRREKRLAIRTALHGMGRAKDVVVVTPEEMDAQKDLAGSIVRPAFFEGRILYDRTA
jgi:predicted nucleotidyltransferase